MDQKSSLYEMLWEKLLIRAGMFIANFLGDGDLDSHADNDWKTGKSDNFYGKQIVNAF